jgi:hypothetical protein
MKKLFGSGVFPKDPKPTIHSHSETFITKKPESMVL